jgi:hypothetical protein
VFIIEGASMQGEKFKEFFVSFNKESCGQSLSKTPELFFERYGFPEMKFLIGDTYEKTRANIFEFVYGAAYCKCCGIKIKKIMPGWIRGWYTTCSEQCRQQLSSERQQGANNSSFRMTFEQRAIQSKKLSEKAKENIRTGKFTPNTNNYKNQRPIKCIINGQTTQVRSLWELIYRLNHPNLLYESLRIRYYDTVKQTDRIYITDFYDPDTNTIVEVRPKAYQPLLTDKKKAVIEQGYSYRIVDEDYFNTQKTPKMLELIESVVCDYEDVKGRLRWLKKA